MNVELLAQFNDLGVRLHALRLGVLLSLVRLLTNLALQRVEAFRVIRAPLLPGALGLQLGDVGEHPGHQALQLHDPVGHIRGHVRRRRLGSRRATSQRSAPPAL